MPTDTHNGFWRWVAAATVGIVTFLLLGSLGYAVDGVAQSKASIEAIQARAAAQYEDLRGRLDRVERKLDSVLERKP